MGGGFGSGWFVVVVSGDGCLSVGVCGEDGVAVVVGWFEVVRFKITIEKERRLSQSRSLVNTRIPF